MGLGTSKGNLKLRSYFSPPASPPSSPDSSPPHTPRGSSSSSSRAEPQKSNPVAAPQRPQTMPSPTEAADGTHASLQPRSVPVPISPFSGVNMAGASLSWPCLPFLSKLCAWPLFLFFWEYCAQIFHAVCATFLAFNC